jgi:hypothetical protein
LGVLAAGIVNYGCAGRAEKATVTRTANNADEKRQPIDTLYGTLIQIAHAGGDAFAQIDKTLGKLGNKDVRGG